MLGRKPKEIDSKLDKASDKLLNQMLEEEVSRQSFSVDLAHLERIRSLRTNNKKRLDPNTMALVAGNLLGILIIVIYEQNHVMASKAKDFILRSSK